MEPPLCEAALFRLSPIALLGSGQPMKHGAQIVAALGPTNTGKTYRALQRMREHETGMIGLPLRLLAREVYDVLTAELGEARVALVTGEEKRIPSRPSYWVCTVEAMPLSVRVDFLAVDEIQLAAHRERGHVFTDRLLHARGAQETWFMGSSAMTSVLQQLLPQVDVRRFPRLSNLRSSGVFTLGSIPKRSAVVTFSAARVYEIAGRLKARRGGAAIVLGALSPRARNAQVAMYQAGEVDYLVATDAIGMGLNLDLDHVVFADTSKFDGKESRPLEIPELAQVAGRAGRFQKDGSFGVLTPREPLPRHVEVAIENHQFAAIHSLVWRNSNLDFSSVTNLLGSLTQRPPLSSLELVRDAEDTATLTQLSRRSEIQARAIDEKSVRLLWETCQIPDYRKILLDQHASLVMEIYVRLIDHGVLDSRWLDIHLKRIEKRDADVETLTSCIAFTRTWTYVACHDEWVDDAKYWQTRTRALEDRLSDALHQALVERFVEKKKRFPVALLPAKPMASTARAAPFAELAHLKAKLEGLSPAVTGPTLIERACMAAYEEFVINADNVVSFDGKALGRLVTGRKILQPDLKLLVDDAPLGQQLQLKRRLGALVLDWVEHVLGPLANNTLPTYDLSAAGRGLVYQLRTGLGTASGTDTQEMTAHLGEQERAVLSTAGIIFGTRSVFARALLKPRALLERERLVRIHFGAGPNLTLGSGTKACVELPSSAWLERLPLLGYVPVGARAIRCDIVEKILSLPRTELDDIHFINRVASLCGCKKNEASGICMALGLIQHRVPRRHRNATANGS